MYVYIKLIWALNEILWLKVHLWEVLAFIVVTLAHADQPHLQTQLYN